MKISNLKIKNGKMDEKSKTTFGNMIKERFGIKTNEKKNEVKEIVKELPKKKPAKKKK
jgi:hypothetical protein